MERPILLSRIILAVCCWLCAVLFIGVGIYSLRTKKPMHFWSGAVVKQSEIRDIPAYNRENAVMWLIYGGCDVLIGFLGVFGYFSASALLFCSSIIIGIPLLVLNYRRIYRKYKK
mgnify:CR=1 FL=1